MVNIQQPEHALSHIQALALIQPDQVALVDDLKEITYGKLLSEIIRVQMTLAETFQIKRGERVGILIENNIDSVVAFLAIIRLGAIAIIINTKLAKPEVGYIIQDSTPVLIVVGSENFLPLIEEQLPVYLIPAESQSKENVKNPVYCVPGFHDDDCAVIIYTSGTTGRPKGAMITHHNITYAVDCYINDVGLTENDSTIVVVPLFYVTGLIAQMMVFLSLGSKIVLLHRFDAARALVKIAEHRITHLHSVATIYLSLVMAMESNKNLDLSCIRQALCGGGPVTDALIEHLKIYLPRLEFRRIYGLTESTSPGIVMPVDVQQMSEKSGSSGLPMRWMKVKVVKDDGSEAKPCVAGELLIRGENVIDSYWKNPEANRASFVDGWLKTGDIAKIDREGFVYILDRKKDMVIRGGEKIFCSEVEGALAQYPGVKEVAVIGIPDSYYGEAVMAIIVPSENAILHKEELIQFARTKLAKFKVPAEIEFADELPRSSVGKILKSVLKNKFTL